MLISLAVWGATFEPVSYLADRCAAAHRSLDRGRFLVEVETKSLYSNERTVYDLAYDRFGKADLVIKRSRPFRIVVSGDTVTEFDPTTRQYSERLRGEESLEVSLRQSAGSLDELVANLVTPEGVNQWLGSLRPGKLWKVSFLGGDIVLSNTVPESRTEVTVSGSDHLLKKVVTKANGYGTEWRLRSGRPLQIGFAPPQDAFKVKTLMPELVSPAYASAAAKRVCEKVFSRYERPKALGYAVDSGDESFRVWVDLGKVRQTDAMADWTVVGQRFTLADLDSKTVSTGKAELSKIVDSVDRSGTRVEPLLRLMLRGINPFRFYLGQNMAVRLAGTTKVQGDVCSILEAESRTSKLSLVVRDRDGFVLSTMSLSKGSEGANTRNFRPLPPTSFSIKPPDGWVKKTLD